MKKHGLNIEDVHKRLLKLQEENEKLRKTHISINEVEKLIEENRKMKLEIQRIINTAQPSSLTLDVANVKSQLSKLVSAILNCFLLELNE